MLETALSAGLVVLAFQKVKNPSESRAWQAPAWGWGVQQWALLAAAGVFLFLLGNYLFHWYSVTLLNPHGHWDAWSIWNLRARFLLSGESWRNGFDPALGWSHTGYPLLLPQFTARSWILLGSRSLWVPAGIGLLFSLEIVGVIVFATAAQRGWVEALTAGCFAVMAVSAGFSFLQYADLPLAFYILSASLLLMMGEKQAPASRGLILLAGFFSSAAAWTKNEGLVWLCVVGAVEAARWMVSRKEIRPFVRRVKWLALGMLPLLGVLVLFKMQVASLDPSLGQQSPAMFLERAADIERYRLVAGAFAKQALFAKPFLVPLLAGYGLIVGLSIRRSAWPGWLRLLWIAAAYFAIYLLTPSPLQWHLDTSLHRLIAQLIPAFILLVFVQGGRLAPKCGEFVQKG